MTKRAPHIREAERSELELWENRRLSPEDFAARMHAPWTAHECEQFDDLVRWFNRRYPTAQERLTATRRLMKQIGPTSS